MNRRFGYAFAALCAPLILMAGVASAADAPAAKKPMTYDCTKAGNKNKAACKDAAAAAPAKAAPATKAAPAAKTTTTTTTTAAKTTTTAAKPAAVATTTTTETKKAMTYDCTKAGNKNKTACKTQSPVAPTPNAAPARAEAVPSARTPAVAAKATTQATNSNIVEWKTTTGKIVHYDCTKAGNKTKQACKGK